MKYLFSNILGCFVFDNQFNLVEEVRFKSLKDYEDRTKVLEGLQKKYRDGRGVPGGKMGKVLGFFKNKKYFVDFHSTNLLLTKQKVKDSVGEDWLIIQAVANAGELERISNTLVKRLREWYSLYLPEFSEQVEDNDKFAELVVKKSKKELLKELGLGKVESMGAELGQKDVEEILSLGREVLGLRKLRKKREMYLKGVMKKYCPNLLELAGVLIGAKLLELGKGLKHLALLPASTVQLLGAEKALFRHIKIGAKCPKFGVIMNHPIVQGAKKSERGKAARGLADKLSLCARLDYFKGEFKAGEYKKELEGKFSK